MSAVLDASAVLAVLFDEPRTPDIDGQVAGAKISTVNLSEIMSRFVRDGVPAEAALEAVMDLGIFPVPFDLEHASLATHLLTETRPLGLSLGNRACLALALAEKLPAYTADRAWAGLNLGVEIVIVR